MEPVKQTERPILNYRLISYNKIWIKNLRECNRFFAKDSWENFSTKIGKMNIVPLSAKVANNRFDQIYSRKQLFTVMSNSG